MPTQTRVFLLSPANCSGKRVGHLLSDEARSPLAARLRAAEGATIGEVFTYVSALYFRGKLEYASAFARTGVGEGGVHVIVPGLGLRPPTELIGLAALRAIGRVPVDLENPSYTGPLQADAARLARALPAKAEVVLLGSIATEKYVGPLRAAFGSRLRVPRKFLGLGVMKRGALLVRCAAERRELEYVGVPPG